MGSNSHIKQYNLKHTIMANTANKTAYTFFEKTIIDNIELSDYGINDDADLFDKINKLYELFKSEYGHMIDRVGRYNAFKEWLQGLPSVLTVPFYNFDIISNYAEYTGRTLEEIEDGNILDVYFNQLSKAFFTLKDNL